MIVWCQNILRGGYQLQVGSSQIFEPATYDAFLSYRAMHKWLAFGCGTVFITQLCGSSAVALLCSTKVSYSLTTLASLEATSMKLNIIPTSIQLAACAIAFLAVDRWGRRPVFLCGFRTLVGSNIITVALKCPRTTSLDPRLRNLPTLLP